jgi:AraC-like DNA-binding protein
MKYISAKLYKKVVDYALEEGLTKSDFGNLPFGPDTLGNLEAVPADDFFELHEQLDQKLGPGFSVRVGQQMKMDDYGVLGLSWKTCSTAGEIFERSERYFMLLSNTYDFKVLKQAGVSRIYLHRDAHRRGVELSNEATFSATVVVLRAMTGKDLVPVEVSFKHRAPQNLSSYQDAFGCPIGFNREHNFMAYKTEDLEERTAKADESINRFLVQRVEEETKGIEVSANTVAHDVKMLIKDALPSGIPGLTQLAEHMGMSTRTLTRRLAESGITFRDLIMKTQEEISKDLLRNTSSTIGEIAFQTGFSEQSAFNRAFKRWTGNSPVEFRKNS